MIYLTNNRHVSSATRLHSRYYSVDFRIKENRSDVDSEPNQLSFC